MTQTMTKSLWSEWINAKYDEFRKGRVGHAAGITEFGRQFGAPHQVVLGWMRDNANPPVSMKYINRILDLYGEEAYEPLGVEKVPRSTMDDRRIKRIMELIEQVPEDRIDELADLIEVTLRLAGFKRIK